MTSTRKPKPTPDPPVRGAGSFEFPDGRRIRLTQDTEGGPVAWYLTEPGDDTERRLEPHEVPELVAEAREAGVLT